MTEIWVTSRQRIRVIWCQLMEFLTGIYGVNEHMGNLHIYDITYNNFLKCEEIWSGETEEYDADYEFGADIAYYEGTDTSGLEEYVQ